MHLRQHKHIWAAIFLKLASDIAKYVGKSENVINVLPSIDYKIFILRAFHLDFLIFFFNTVKQMVIINYDWILGIFFLLIEIKAIHF